MPIPTPAQGQTSVNLRRVPSVNSTAQRAEAQMWGEISNQMGRVASVFGQIDSRRVAAERERQGAIDGASEDFDPNQTNVRTSGARIYRDSALKSYMARLEMDTQTALSRINVEQSQDPDSMVKSMNAYIDKTATDMPADVAANYKVMSSKTVNSLAIRAFEAKAARERDLAKRDTLALIDIAEERLGSFGIPQSAEDEELMAVEFAKYQSALDGAVESGFLAENETVLRREQLRGRVEDSTIMSAIQQAPNKLEFALAVAEGRSGTALDEYTPAARQKALASAQSLYSVEEQIESKAKAAQAAARKRFKTNAYKNLYANPESPQNNLVLEALENYATSPDDIVEVQRLRDFLENAQTERFTESNPQHLSYLESLAARGDLTLDELDMSHGSENKNIRLATSDYRRLVDEVESNREGLVNTITWESWQERLDLEFPSLEKMSTSEMMLALVTGNSADPNSGLSGDDLAKRKSFEKAKQALRVEAKTKIADGDISSESDLNEFLGEEYAKMKQRFGSKSLGEGLTVQPPVLQMLPQDVRDNYPLYLADENKFLSDVASGKLTAEQANVIDKAIKESRNAKP